MSGEVEPRHVHPAQLNVRRSSPALGANQHGRTEVDADHLGSGRVERKVAAGADPGVEYSSREPAKEQRPDFSVASVLERQIEQVIDPSDALISIETGERHVLMPSAAESAHNTLGSSDTHWRPDQFAGVEAHVGRRVGCPAMSRCRGEAKRVADARKRADASPLQVISWSIPPIPARFENTLRRLRVSLQGQRARLPLHPNSGLPEFGTISRPKSDISDLGGERRR
jgi:hypothetical protein